MTGRHYRNGCSKAIPINYMLSISIFPEEEGVDPAYESRSQLFNTNDENNDLIIFRLNFFFCILMPGNQPPTSPNR
eukprot:scaffold6900_cov93-Skeletonema_marinoi.AAC.4